MPTIKELLIDMVDDIGSIEIAIIKENGKDKDDKKIMTYSRLAIEGDAVHFLNTDPELKEQLLAELQTELLKSSIRSRNAMVSVLSTALKGIKLFN